MTSQPADVTLALAHERRNTRHAEAAAYRLAAQARHTPDEPASPGARRRRSLVRWVTALSS